MNTSKNQNIVYFTDSTLRDGEQCRVAEISTTKRIEVFKQILKTGIDVIEVGHGANPNDWQLIIELIKLKDQFKNKARLQILFGSQFDLFEEKITQLKKLLGSEIDLIVLHIYDRLDQNLRHLAGTNYSVDDSVQRVAKCLNFAADLGFSNFSISGEGATGLDPDAAADFYCQIVSAVKNPPRLNYFNINLANTYGLSLGWGSAWNLDGLRSFKKLVDKIGHKRGLSLGFSIHSHNDYGSAINSSLLALQAGFDRVEGTLIGMGERAGNAALCDLILRILEISRASALSSPIKLSSGLSSELNHWFEVCQTIVELYSSQSAESEACRRWQATALGNPSAFEAGSGPHDHGTKGHFEQPLETPGWNQYLYSSLVRAILADPQAEQVLDFDPSLAKKITLAKHTGGGSTQKVIAGEIKFSNLEEYSAARQNATSLKSAVKKALLC